MKIIEAINRIDSLKHNTYSQSDKVGWLSRLDSMVKRLVIDTHEGGEGVVFKGYTDEADLLTTLLVPAPYDDVYIRYLEMQINYANGEFGKYNNSRDMFEEAYDAFARSYNRDHMPIGRKFKFF